MFKKNSPPTSNPTSNNNSNDPDAIDAVFDNVCPVPDNVGEAVAIEESAVVTEFPTTATSETKAIMVEDEGAPAEGPTEAVEADGEEGTMEKVLSKFDMNCCVKNPTKQIDESKPQPLEGDDATETKGDDPSLSELAARMNDIDLESATEGDFQADVSKQLLPWYREPFYASLIVLCGLFTIAIIVMAILLFKK